MVGEVFSSVASSYDAMNDAMSMGIHRVWKDYFVSSVLSLPPTLSFLQQQQQQQQQQRDPARVPEFRILDVAGGTGDISFRALDVINEALGISPALPPRHPLATVTVCDINPEMLTVGEQRAVEKYGNANVEKRDERSGGGVAYKPSQKPLCFYEGDAQSLPFPDETFDIYTIAFGLRNVTDPTLAIRDAYRVLKRGGRLVIMEFSHPRNPVFKEFYDAYSFNVIPAMGKAIADDKESYQYLVESIRKFDKQEELVKRMEREGFQSVKYEELNMGIVAIHDGWKM